jgi:hypothetical protein
MMVLQADADFIAFLTAAENTRYVLAILERQPQIYTELEVRFLNCLKSHLEANMPQPSDWEMCVKPPDDDYDALMCTIASAEREGQYLRHNIEISWLEDAAQITACVVWVNEELWRNEKLRNLKGVKALASQLKTAGWKKGAKDWLSYKHLFKYSSLETFLLQMEDEGKKRVVLQGVCDAFWPIVQKTATHIADANAEIARVIRK